MARAVAGIPGELVAQVRREANVLQASGGLNRHVYELKVYHVEDGYTLSSYERVIGGGEREQTQTFETFHSLSESVRRGYGQAVSRVLIDSLLDGPAVKH